MSRSLVDTTLAAAVDLADEARSLLASERGRRLRGMVAGAVIVGAPVLTRLPLLRRSLLGRVLGAAALAAVLVKGAEWLRDWEPQGIAVPFDR